MDAEGSRELARRIGPNAGSAPRPLPEQDREAWEAGLPVPLRVGPWLWVVLAIIIALSLFV